MRSHLRYRLHNYRHNKEHLNEKAPTKAGPQKTIRPFVQKASFQWTKEHGEHRPQDSSGMGFAPNDVNTAFHLCPPSKNKATKFLKGGPVLLLLEGDSAVKQLLSHDPRDWTQ